VAITAEWRSYGEFDVVLILEDGVVKEALTADPAVLHDFLAVLLPNVAAWEGDHAVEGDKLAPDAWGTLIMSRAANGDITDLDPERFWAGIGIWFRSRGVDYNTPLPKTANAE
jgi:hypothetical protein